MMNLKIQCSQKLILLASLLHSVSGEEGGESTTTNSSAWVITFSIVGVLMFLMSLCGVWRCCLIKRRYRRLSSESVDDPPSLTPDQVAIARQYPPLLEARNNSDRPPSYNEVSTAYTQLQLHGLRNSGNTWKAYKEGQKFNRDHPPYEVLPPANHIRHIIASGGPKAWKIRLEESVRNNNLANISNDGRVVKFKGKFDKIVQTNYPLFRPYESDTYSESHTEWFYYYEITILSNPKKDKKDQKDSIIAIGLTAKPYPPFRLPGFHMESVGWHSNEGHVFHNESYGGKPYSEMWGNVGDVLGCGYYHVAGVVFFTKNGRRLGDAFSGVKHIWFPTVGTDDEYDIEFNFGGEREFLYEGARGTSVAGPI